VQENPNTKVENTERRVKRILIGDITCDWFSERDRTFVEEPFLPSYSDIISSIHSARERALKIKEPLLCDIFQVFEGSLGLVRAFEVNAIWKGRLVGNGGSCGKLDQPGNKPCMFPKQRSELSALVM